MKIFTAELHIAYQYVPADTFVSVQFSYRKKKNCFVRSNTNWNVQVLMYAVHSVHSVHRKDTKTRTNDTNGNIREFVFSGFRRVFLVLGRVFRRLCFFGFYSSINTGFYLSSLHSGFSHFSFKKKIILKFLKKQTLPKTKNKPLKKSSPKPKMKQTPQKPIFKQKPKKTLPKTQKFCIAMKWVYILFFVFCSWFYCEINWNCHCILSILEEKNFNKTTKDIGEYRLKHLSQTISMCPLQILCFTWCFCSFDFLFFLVRRILRLHQKLNFHWIYSCCTEFICKEIAKYQMS